MYTKKYKEHKNEKINHLILCELRVFSVTSVVNLLFDNHYGKIFF